MIKLKNLLDEKAAYYNNPTFIENDPITIPHQFTLKQDREIMGFFASILAWGQRKTIINKCHDLIIRFENEPYRFIKNHSDEDLKAMIGFKHRTFNDTDLLYFVDYLRRMYNEYDTLEDAFLQNGNFNSIEESLINFEYNFFNHPNAPARTRKHIATPARNSACKRLNMFLRWMVRSDDNGVDFGLWKRIPKSELICPIDVHVDRTARKLGLITRKQTDWKTAVQLTDNLRKLDRDDPVKYDFALFGLSINPIKEI
ncbi:MAG: TIGR02757 family protein [Fermentimonas sp.]|nr:TIGR02757 family protein [Fermentimonas sp.]